ncbi:blue-light-activated protein [bacterium BMS3Bbin06]|nr:blue-light-activated protein [bacterium BMS3Abin08]GBE33644.1 blue-light-activated protein [bacterium BMS3Bbin06]HDO35003.1 PAS domain S-box protein [Nitrospirota bacterium]
MRAVLYTCLFVWSILLITPCIEAANNQPLETVVMQLKWRHQFQFAGYYAAIEKGYYRQAGLEVILKEWKPGMIVADEVVSGRADFGVDMPVLLLERQRGNPVVVLAAIFQHSPEVLVAKKDSGIVTPHDLLGRRVMLNPHGNSEIRAMLLNEAVRPEDIEIVDHTWNLNDLVQGKVDAFSGYVTDLPFLLGEQGIAYSVIRPVSYGIDFYGDCLFTSEKEIKDHPVRVRAFLEASLRGWEYAMEHPKEIIELILTKYSTKRSRPALHYEADRMRELILPRFIEIGHMNPGRWKHIADTFVNLGMLSPDYSLKGFLYKPDLNPDYTWVRWTVGVTVLALLLVSAGAVFLFFLSRHLRNMVEQRTMDLSRINRELVSEITKHKETEERLRASEERYRFFLNSANDAIFIHGIDRAGLPSTFIEVNDGAASLLGYRKEELSNMSPFDIILPEKHAAAEGYLVKIHLGEKYITESTFVARDKKIIPVEISMHAFELHGKKMVLSIARDITERKQREQELRSSEKKFEMAFSSSPDAITISTLHDGRLLEVNDAFEHKSGYSREESIGKSTLDLGLWISPEQRNEFIMKLKKHGAIRDFEFDFKTKSGKFIQCLISAEQIEFEGKRCIVSITRDISARKRAEEKLQQAEMMYRTIFEQSSNAIILIDPATTMPVEFNDRILQVLGYSHEEFSTMQLSAIDTVYSPGGIREIIKKTLHEGRQEFEGKLKTKSGGLIDAIISMRTIKIEDKLYLHTIVCDITEQMRLQEQLRQAQKMEAVGQLAGGIAHDFNNILTAIVGYGNILQIKMEKDNPLSVYVDNILFSAEKAADLTHSLLAFSRKQVMEARPVDLNEIIRTTGRLLHRLIGEDIELRTILNREDMIVMADGNQLEQVLMNLATNARDAMPCGGGLTIETGVVEIDSEFVATHGYGTPGEYAMIEVSDTGSGMDQETKEKIFEPFFTTKGPGKGTGLGLSTAYGTIRQHNGFIHVYSEPGEGTVFRIHLPLVHIEVEKLKQAGTAIPKAGSETILLAEDDETLRELTAEVLAQVGYNIIVAKDGEDAVKRFHENKEKIDFLLLDVIMPGNNGKEVYEEAKKDRPDIKALFISGYPGDVLYTKGIGIYEEKLNIISKPASPSTLLSKIREILDSPA